MQVKIKVHAHLRPTESDPEASITGPLYVQIGDMFFPAEGGGTYVVRVLGWWIENAMRIFLSGSNVENIFMDNNYKFCLRRASGSDVVTLQLYDGSGRPLGKHTISYRRYLATLRGAAKSVLNEIEEKGLHGGTDTETLRDRLKHLERLEADIKARGLP